MIEFANVYGIVFFMFCFITSALVSFDYLCNREVVPAVFYGVFLSPLFLSMTLWFMGNYTRNIL